VVISDYHSLNTILASQKTGRPGGIVSICSAHPVVLQAAIRSARASGATLLVESTCNQVNQFGGYTGMTPADFATYMINLCNQFGLPSQRLILGGDHLGPNVWEKEPAAQAMQKSHTLVRDYIRAGYQKIHLDTSMSLGDDPSGQPLPPEVIAVRSAQLAKTAEGAFDALGQKDNYPRYVIGTEVPPPGGMQSEEQAIHITEVEGVQETINLTRQAFLDAGLAAAWERVIAVVVHPGVEFGHEVIYPYERAKTILLKQFIESQSGLTYEAHSTDYQTRSALRQMVQDHFVILKVGPWLSFTYREAVYALDMIELELLGEGHPRLSNVRQTLESAMLQDPSHWQGYYQGNPQHRTLLRHFSFSDRIRYYWALETVQASVSRLIRNLSESRIPLSLLSQYLPIQYASIRCGTLENNPQDIIIDAIRQVLKIYEQACSPD